jgi:gamma-glutamyltranspeptidase/glutathione hydrolase
MINELIKSGMQHSGLGGGGFMLVRDSHGNYESIGCSPLSFENLLINTLLDFRETAPAAAHKDMYQGNVEGSIYTGLASAIPGDLAGLEALHKKYGVWMITPC